MASNMRNNARSMSFGKSRFFIFLNKGFMCVFVNSQLATCCLFCALESNFVPSISIAHSLSNLLKCSATRSIGCAFGSVSASICFFSRFAARSNSICAISASRFLFSCSCSFVVSFLFIIAPLLPFVSLVFSLLYLNISFACCPPTCSSDSFTLIFFAATSNRNRRSCSFSANNFAG